MYKLTDLYKQLKEEDTSESPQYKIYCDMEGFAILEDGTLILVDECGSFAYCPPDRFQVVKADQEKTDLAPRVGKSACNRVRKNYSGSVRR
jgi:hypothetical protein